MKIFKHNWVIGVVFLSCFIFVFHIGFADDICIFTETDEGGPYTFTAPVVPATRTTSSNRIYLAFFWPSPGNFWAGNVVKLGISADWVIVGADGAPATLPNGAIREDAVPFWATIDWADPNKSNYIHNSGRNIYTYLGSSRDLTDLTNEFKSTNDGLTEAILGNPANHTTAQLIDFVRGADVNGQNREVITGDVLHSEPLVVQYNYPDNSSKTMVYFGANDGMLHAVLDTEVATNGTAVDYGTEAWAFIPPDQLNKLKEIIEGTSHQYFVDSSPKAYFEDVNKNGVIDSGEGDRIILVCGERKGGTSYFALDVTDPSAPLFLWRINQYDDAEVGALELVDVTGAFEDGEVLTGSSGGSATVEGAPVGNLLLYELRTSNFTVGEVVTGLTSRATGIIVSIINYAPDVIISELGESWSEPQFGLVKTSDTDTDGTPVFFIGGGYSSDNSAGKAVFAISVFDSAVIKEFTNNTITDMNYSIPSSVTVVDGDSNGFVDKVYAGDLGSQMWRFGKFTDSDNNALTFPATDENIMNWTDQAAHILFLSDAAHGRKFFYPPSVTLELGYDLVSIGTGDREDPCNPIGSDRIYAVKDSHEDSGQLTEMDLVDVTDPRAPVPDLNDETGDVDNNRLVDQGWYIRLREGEKVLSEGVVFFKTYYVTTFLPGEGAATLYALHYLTGEAVLTFEEILGPNGLDIIRSVEIGHGISSKPVVVITEAVEKLLVPVGITNPAGSGTGPVGPGILVIEPAAPPSNFFYLWWKEL
ncbi:MAG: hypothetical protein JSV50_21295 [Desulfobacteraceae bacterium]|nr:MAG: hypothetical protein JSV50_21295 [Desulfobacteraceae bacterium]